MLRSIVLPAALSVLVVSAASASGQPAADAIGAPPQAAEQKPATPPPATPSKTGPNPELAIPHRVPRHSSPISASS